jgi:hypothetical protein
VTFLRDAPGVTYPTALGLVAHFKGQRVADLVLGSDRDFVLAAPWLSTQQRRGLLNYFTREVGLDATS